MFYRFMRTLSFVFLSIWWIFFLIWQPGFSDLIAKLSYMSNPPEIALDTADLARRRALVYAIDGGSRSSDIFFTQDEVSHLLDVQNIYKPLSLSINILAIISWGILIVAVYQKNIVVKDLELASKILSFLLGGFVLALLFFDTFFRSFHKILFPQGNWQFAESSMLIQIFPESFWIGMVISIAIFLSTCSLLLWLLSKKK